MTGALVTIPGNITAEPELRFTQTGLPVLSFDVAHTPRVLRRADNEWVDGETLFLRVNVWRDQAQNVASSLVKGAAVLVIGRLVSRTYQTREGETRHTIECEADIVSIDLRRQRVESLTRVRRSDTAASPAPADPAPEPASEPQRLRSTSAA